ncbi:MAG: dnaX 2 [Planctomycetota bacterium]|nr:dnaX 2 [Planctomycetota bacterium]
MPWGSLRGHETQVDSLRRAMVGGRLPHAFLFVGPSGIGKRLFARTLAQALLCERNPESRLLPCGQCPSCLQVVEGTHPDVLVVSRPEDRQELPIRAIRQLCLDLGLKPMRGSRRVAIVEDADDLSDEAANAFLKTLEEPPPNSVLILVGTAAEVQLDTILSRCRVVRFEPLSVENVKAILIERGLTTDPQAATRLAEQSEGSVARAEGLANASLEEFRRAMIDELGDPHRFDPQGFARRLDAFSKEAGKESSPQRECARLLIGELARFFRGILWQTAGVDPASPDQADRRAIAVLAERMEPEDVFILADRCLEADLQVQRNANRALIFESLSHDIGSILNQAR